MQINVGTIVYRRWGHAILPNCGEMRVRVTCVLSGEVGDTVGGYRSCGDQKPVHCGQGGWRVLGKHHHLAQDRTY